MTMNNSEDTEEIKQLRKKLLKKPNDNVKNKYKKGGQPVFAKLVDGTVLSFPTYTSAAEYFEVTTTAISLRVDDGTVAKNGKVAGVSFYIEE